MVRCLRHVAVLLWVCDVFGDAPETSHADKTSISSQAVYTTGTVTLAGTAGLSSTGANATCPSRTVNYITHTLPRQCLRTDRVPQNSTQNVTSAEAAAHVTSTVDVVDSPETTNGAAVTKIVNTNVPAEAGIQFSEAADNITASASSHAIAATPLDVPEQPGSDEAESPLDNAKFLSFEDWKRQNLEKTGQSPDDVGRSHPVNPNRPRPGINNALDTLGEESEINLDFTGFGGSAQVPVADPPRGPSGNVVETHAGRQSAGSLLRSKDAGKTCKERTNYASFDCSATVLKSNKECKSASSVLVENKDSYMLNTCSADNKFFIVELCNDIQIDTIVLANYEFFSSSFRHFRVSVSDRYPVKMEKWRDLGTFEARNTREIQAFLVENPLIWAKYLRIEFLTHYGTEYYCPVSVLRVHGTTMIEEFRHQEQEELLGNEEEDVVTLEAEASANPAVAQEPIESTDESAKATIQSIPDIAHDLTDTAAKHTDSTISPHPTADPVEVPAGYSTNATAELLPESGSAQVGAYEPSNVNMTCETATTEPDVAAASPNSTSDKTAHSPVVHNGSEGLASTDAGVSSTEPVALNTGDSSQRSSTTGAQSSAQVAPNTSESAHPQTDGIAKGPPVANNGSVGPTSHNSQHVALNSTMPEIGSSHIASSTNSTRSGTVVTSSAHAAQPSTQESFFKSFHKRLQQLESNSTLSLQYIEEQSRILRDAFSKVEKRQVGTTTKFLSQLNETVMAELQGFRQAYDQLWQSTVIELEGQRETYQREMLALSARLTMVADELVWQKRMGIIQSTILLLCLAMVLFGRGGNGYLEVPLMQSMVNRSTAALRAGWESPPNSPSPNSRSPVSLFRRKLWRSSTEPAGETNNLTESDASRPQTREGPEGPEVVVDPPSPRMNGSPSDVEDSADMRSSPEFDRQKTADLSSPEPSPKKKKRSKKHSPSGSESRLKSPLAM